MLFGFHKDNAILIEQTRITFDQNLKVAFVPKGLPRGAIRQDVSASIPLATFSVAPMPEPVSRYHSPEALVGSASASAPQAHLGLMGSAVIPTRGERALQLRPRQLRAATISKPPFTLAGSDFGPTKTKSLYITSNRSTPQPSATNLLLGLFSVHQQHIAIPVDGVADRLPGANRDDAYVDARLGLKPRQNVIQQARVLALMLSIERR